MFFVVRRSVCVLVAFQFVLVCVLVSRHRKRKNSFFRFVVFFVGNRKTGQCKTPKPCEDFLPLKGREVLPVHRKAAIETGIRPAPRGARPGQRATTDAVMGNIAEWWTPTMCCRRQVLLRDTENRRRVVWTIAITIPTASAIPTGDEVDAEPEDMGAMAARGFTNAILRTVARRKATGRGAGETKTAKKGAGAKKPGGLRARVRGRVIPACPNDRRIRRKLPMWNRR